MLKRNKVNCEYLEALIKYMSSYLNKIYGIKTPEYVIEEAIHKGLSIKNKPIKAVGIASYYLTSLKNGYYIPLEVIKLCVDYDYNSKIEDAEREYLRMCKDNPLTLEDIIISCLNRLNIDYDENLINDIKKLVERLAKNKTLPQKLIPIIGAVIYYLQSKYNYNIHISDIGELLNISDMAITYHLNKLKARDEYGETSED